MKYHDKQYIATIKGVDENFFKVTGVDTMLADSRVVDSNGNKKFELASGDTDYAIVGGGIAYNLQLNMGDFFSQLDLYAPRRDGPGIMIPPGAMVIQSLMMTGSRSHMAPRCPNTGQGIPGGLARRVPAIISGIPWILPTKTNITSQHKA